MNNDNDNDQHIVVLKTTTGNAPPMLLENVPIGSFFIHKETVWEVSDVLQNGLVGCFEITITNGEEVENLPPDLQVQVVWLEVAN